MRVGVGSGESRDDDSESTLFGLECVCVYVSLSISFFYSITVCPSGPVVFVVDTRFAEESQKRDANNKEQSGPGKVI